MSDSESVDVIKIDAQGMDLAILAGGRETIDRHGPLLIVEAIFVPLYDAQSAPEDILTFATDLGYRLLQIINVHDSRHDSLAFADFVFTRRPAEPDEMQPPFRHLDADRAAALQDEVRQLRLRARRASERIAEQRRSLRQQAERLKGLRELVTRLRGPQ